MNKLLIIGAGGHGKVVAEAALSMGAWDEIAFLDAKYPRLKEVIGHPVIGDVEDVNDFVRVYQSVAVAVGDNDIRIDILNKFGRLGFACPSIIHSSAWVSATAILGVGTVILAKVVINAEANLGIGCIVNTGAIIEHDCRIGDGVHVCPGASLGGGVSVGRNSWIGIGASVIHCVEIGERVTVGAGAAVINNIDSNLTVAGVPAREIFQGC